MKPEAEPPIVRLVGPEEAIESRAKLGEAEVVVTSHRLVVASTERTFLNVPIDGLRRIQFDIERQRPATLVIVPESPVDEPQVLAVSPPHYEEVANAIVIVGKRLVSL
jgi:hypothetical protein